MSEAGGILSFKDLKTYAVTSSEPIESTFKSKCELKYSDAAATASLA